MASIVKVLLLLLFLDPRTAETKKKEAVVAPDDEASRIRGLWKLQMKELKGKGGSENGKKSLTSFCVNSTKTDDECCLMELKEFSFNGNVNSSH